MFLMSLIEMLHQIVQQLVGEVHVTEVLVQTIRFLSKKQADMQTGESPGVIQTVPLI
ncbi:hypothetical protein M3221_10580 [Domibacillus indicus]|uniref:hypothetical protein n=1 Tax=Domibacillus indicus TaxID=1437523 RepID=UPI00203E7AC6|nr:hypothetical protein [Domibacillus indicus]MCM3788850.1 hypothetical protein [Domibacillus indicus]